jgi:hypothetical protein
MTENEAIARFKSCQENVGKCEKCRFYSCCGIYDMEDTAIKALEEVQQYRAIGTVEELETASKYLRLVKKHGTVGKTIEECAEYEEIGTVEEFREAVEKQTAYYPDRVVHQLEERTAFLKDCTKYGNKTAEQQSKSYDTMMMYEVKDLVGDLLEIVKAGGTDDTH